MSLENEILVLMDRLSHNLRSQPLNLGGITSAGGGTGGPPGGFVGVLPQTQLAYDTTEGIEQPGSTFPTPSLFDNLCHIRYRLTNLEASGIGTSGYVQVRHYNGAYPPRNALNFEGSGVTVLDDSEHGSTTVSINTDTAINFVTDLTMSSPPTDLQLDTKFGTPWDVGDNFITFLESNGNHVYLIATDGRPTAGGWFYVEMTMAT